MKKATRILSILIVILLLVAACQTAPPQEPTPPIEVAPTPIEPPSPDDPLEEVEDFPNFNRTGYPIVDEMVTLRVLFSTSPDHPADFNDIELVRRDEELTNVRIDYILVPGVGFAERRNLMLATGDLPDIIESPTPVADLIRFGAEGTFIPMQELIRDFMPNFLRVVEEIPMLWPFITAPDGNIYGLARVNAGPWMTSNGLGIINQAWLDELGLDMPTNIDEFHEVLRAFKERDPNSIPFLFAPTDDDQRSLTGNNGLGYIMHSFGLPVGIEPYTAVRDGEVICLATMPEMREAIRFFATLYSEGLIDMEAFTLDNSAFRARLNSDPMRVGYSQVWDINDIVSNPENNEMLVYMPLLYGPDGRVPQKFINPMPGIARGWGVITSACELPHVAARWMDRRFDPINAIEHNEGPRDLRLLAQPDGTYHVRPAPEGMSVAQDRFSHATTGLVGLTPSAYQILKLPHTDPKVNFVRSIPDRFIHPEPMLPVYYTIEESEIVVQLQTDVTSYINRRFSEWIMNGRIDDEWYDFLEEIERVGRSRLFEIRQAAFDRFMAAAG